MKCTVCGGRMQGKNTDLPFKISDRTILILKDLPVLAYGNCGEYLIENAVMKRVDELVAGVGSEAELEIVRYAA